VSYQYKSQSPDKLEAIAATIHREMADYCNGFVVDIEAIVENYKITILPRRGNLHRLALGYTARDPHFIVMSELTATHPPTYRCVVAEEVSHIILEWELYNGKPLPEGAEGHELTAAQHQLIETEAHYLSRAILCQKEHFLSQFEVHKSDSEKVDPTRPKILRATVDLMAREFHVPRLFAGYRARDLKVVTEAECKANLSDRLAF
jgi:Zn-dependent peptidase ImmA (M78 family)